MPKCSTKNGIHRTGKKIYVDLQFNVENQVFVDWMDSFSEKMKNLIYEKKDYWFQSEMGLDDIEYHWQKILRSYKKTNLLLRCIIKKPKSINHKELVMIYDEDENTLPLDSVQSDTLLIPLVEITGLKFTSQSFLIEFALRQVMILNDITEGEARLISHKKPTTPKDENLSETMKAEVEKDIADKKVEEAQKVEEATKSRRSRQKRKK